MLAESLRTPRERLLFKISVVISSIAWLALTLSVVGIAYALMILAFILIAHAMFLAYVTMNGVRLSPTQLPHLYEKVVKASARLGLKAPPEVYVMQAGGILNAFATRLLSRNFIILYADLIEACEDANPMAGAEPSEADFIIAHELGHLAAGHLKWLGFLAPARVVPWIGPAYSRACEYTCDACGHEITSDLTISSRALTILATGGRNAPRVNLDEFVNQRSRSGQFWAAVYELNSSHPFLPKRIAALRERLTPGAAPAVPRGFFAYLLAPLFGLFGMGGAGGLVGIMAMVAVIGVLAAVAIPNFVAMQLRAKRAELPANVDQIRIAELAYHGAYDSYLACGDSDTAQALVGKEARDWSQDPMAECFARLGWSPEGKVRGAYWVEVIEGGGETTFAVHGISDLDGDGVTAYFIANAQEQAVMRSANNVY